ncbi:hypothetical protein ACJMK2_037076 [Sinanodonta woodiana]|uniref:Neutral alpha-glucosidase AB n=1 Tax=Sinanodonta woodiana TaxID=1069815 RepID=A0ABD3WKI8_SINWO
MALSIHDCCRRLKSHIMRIDRFFVSLLLISQVFGVNKENFKTCDQSGFCKRQRAMEPGKSPYVVMMDSINVKPSKIEVQVLNKENDVRLLLEVFTLAHNTARIKINELQPLKPRYEIPPGDVLIEEPKQQQMTVTDVSNSGATLTFENNKIIIHTDPFRIDFLANETPVVVVNAQGLLKFEHLRTKEQGKQDPVPNEGEGESNADSQQAGEVAEGEKPAEEEKKKEDNEEPSMWEETFKTFHDSKPNGPTSIGLDISFPNFEHVYGIPEHADSMALKSTKNTDPYRLFNLDVFEYDLYNPMALYGSVPVMLAHNIERTVGIYWNNAAETWIDIGSNVADKNFFSKMADLVKGMEMPQVDTHWMSESGVIDVFIMLGPSVKDVFYQYAQLTGTTFLPPLFAISYHQCRWNYNDEEDVKNVDASFDKVDIPLDVIWLDIEHTDGKRYFTWASDKFPNPVDMLKHLGAKGRRMVTIVDPHLKRDDNYKVYSEAKSKDLMVKTNNGVEYEGWCWPGSSSWPDFTNPEVRKWWTSKFQYSEYTSAPNLFIWNDMNEPSVFNGPEITFHKDVVHYGGWENRDLHNLYGLYVHQATSEGQLLRSDNQERPFVLTRALFAGSQRFGAVWTGDNTGEWGHLKVSNPMLLSLSLTGITFSGADIGGFFRNPEPELLTRWYQAGAFQPFFRAHAHLDTKRREPYLLPEEHMRSIRNSIRLRYSYLPYWYTLFYENERSGTPPMRPLWVEFPQDTQTFTMDDEYLIGSDLLVKPITEQGQTSTSVYFPGKGVVWYDIENFEAYNGDGSATINAGLDKVPVFQRSGSIIPRKLRIRRSSALMTDDPFTLFICLDSQGKASGELYVDDYHSLKYKNGQFVHKQFQFSNNILSSKAVPGSGSYDTKEWIERVIIVGLKKGITKVVIKSKDGEQALQSGYDSSAKIFVIRKPSINIQTDFIITLQ